MVDRYSVIASLGVGGMAEIFLATRNGPEGFQRVVVLKRVLPDFAEDSAFVDMFLDEARLIAKIRHPNVVQVHDLGHGDKGLFLAMEYLHGENARTLLRRLNESQLRLDPVLAAVIVSEAAAGLHAAHELRDGKGKHGVVHRDISPENLFITYDGDVKVIDFGIAKTKLNRSQTQSGAVKGKAAYMSPEQIMARGVDRRTDVFALGIVLWELVSGKRLFSRATPPATWVAVLSEDIPSLREAAAECPPEIVAACQKALERDLDKRYQSADELRRDLVAFIMRSGLEQLPRDTLASLMQTLFDEERKTREKLLDDSSVIVSVRTLEIAPMDAQLPSGTLSTTSRHRSANVAGPGETHAGTAAATSLPLPPKPRTRRATLVLPALLLVLATLSGLGLGLRRRSGVKVTSTPATVAATVTPPTVVAPTPPALRPPDAATSPLAKIRIESAPPGAQLLLEGRPRGVTPINVDIAADRPVALELRHAGYHSFSTELEPDGETTRRFVLTPKHSQAPKETTTDPSYPRFE